LDAPTTRLSRFLPALREDLHRRSSPLVLDEGGTTPPATRFPRRGYPPRIVRPRPSLGQASHPKTTTGDHNVASPPRPVVLHGPPPSSCGALRTASGRLLLTKPLSPRQGGDTLKRNVPACYMQDHCSSGVAQGDPLPPGEDQVELPPPRWRSVGKALEALPPP